MRSTKAIAAKARRQFVPTLAERRDSCGHSNIMTTDIVTYNKHDHARHDHDNAHHDRGHVQEHVRHEIDLDHDHEYVRRDHAQWSLL